MWEMKNEIGAKRLETQNMPLQFPSVNHFDTSAILPKILPWHIDPKTKSPSQTHIRMVQRIQLFRTTIGTSMFCCGKFHLPKLIHTLHIVAYVPCGFGALILHVSRPRDQVFEFNKINCRYNDLDIGGERDAMAQEI